MEHKKLALALGFAAAVLAPSMPANSEPFQLSSSGIWTAVVPPGLASLEGLGTNEIRFGDAAGIQKSGYRFDGAVVGVPTSAALLGGEFEIGEFTHLNFPIFPPSITGATLLVSLTVDDLGNGEDSQDFSFNFTHTETPNFPGGATCPATGTPTASVPAGCPDVVGLQNLFSEETITIDGVERILQIVGFVDPGTGDIVEQFVTFENQANTAALLVRFAAPVTVREPASLALLGTGIAFIGWTLRRRRR